MKLAKDMISIAAAQPQAALTDVLGLSARCAMVFGGFIATSLF